MFFYQNIPFIVDPYNNHPQYPLMRKRKAQARKPFTKEEDAELVAIVNSMSDDFKGWDEVAARMKTRNSRQCRERWVGYLSPDIRVEKWTKEEDEILIKMTEKLGRKWTEISACLNGRSGDDVKNRWYSHLKYCCFIKEKGEKKSGNDQMTETLNTNNANAPNSNSDTIDGNDNQTNDEENTISIIDYQKKKRNRKLVKRYDEAMKIIEKKTKKSTPSKKRTDSILNNAIYNTSNDNTSNYGSMSSSTNSSSSDSNIIFQLNKTNDNENKNLKLPPINEILEISREYPLVLNPLFNISSF